MAITWLATPMKPLRNGFVKASYGCPIPSKTVIHFQPITDVPSTDYSCIYSAKMARKNGHDPVLTFDQPLYWKTMEIITHQQQKGFFNKMVIMLGTFHTCMSFNGSIGYKRLALIFNLYWS